MASDRWSVVLHTNWGTFERNTKAVAEMLSREVSETILGYTLCERCDTQVPTDVARITGGLCSECARKQLAPVSRELEVMIDGARTPVNVERSRKKYGSRGNPATRRKAEAAKRRALRRLRWLHPQVYEFLLAEERRKAGLEPYSLARAVRQTIESPEA